MPVNIHGKQYMTVAERVNDFRNVYEKHTIETQLIQNDHEYVVMKALIFEGEQLLATGYAEEKRGSSQINKTSALENCETSAIGRALAAFGFGGTEYASANEVQNAISQQEAPQQVSPEPINDERVDGCYEMLKGEIDGDNDEPDYERMQTGISRISNDERLSVFDKFGKDKPEGAKRMYATIISDCLKMKNIDGVWQK